MAKHPTLYLAYLGLCLHVWLFLNIYAMSAPTVPALEEMHIGSDSHSEPHRKRDALELTIADDSETRPVGDVSEGSTKHRYSATLYNNNRDDDNSSHLTRDNVEQKRSSQEDKRRLRFIKRRESGQSYARQNKHASNSRYHSLRRREAFPRERRTWSVSTALQALTDMVVAHEQRRLAVERDAMRQRLLEVGKRSEEIARKNEAAGHGESDFVSLLETALSSS